MKYLILIALLSVGCGNKNEPNWTREVKVVISEKDKEAVAKFVLDCVKGATPKSTGEDQSNPASGCMDAAIKIYGVTKMGKSYPKTYPLVFIPDQP